MDQARQSPDEVARGRVVEADGAADQPVGAPPLAVPEDLVAVADQLTLEVEDARRRCAGLTAEDVSLPVRDERQVAGLNP